VRHTGGTGTPDMRVSERDREAAEGIARITAGGIFPGPARAGTGAREKSRRIDEPGAEPEKTGSRYGRASGAIALAVASGNKP